MNIDTDMLVDENNRVWFINAESDGLFCINFEDKKINYVSQIPNGGGFRKYNSGVVNNNKIYFFPYNANNLLVYDIASRSFQEIEANCFSSGMAQYTIALAYKDDVIAISTYGEKSVVQYCIQENTFYKYKLKGMSEGNISRDYVICNDKLYLVKIDRPNIIEINLNTFEEKEYYIKSSKYGFGTISTYNKLFVLTGIEGVYLIDSTTFGLIRKCDYPSEIGRQNEKGLVESFDTNMGDSVQPFAKSMEFDNKIFMISATANKSLIYDILKNIFQKIDLEDEDNEITFEKFPISQRFSSIKHIACLKAKDGFFFTVSRAHDIRFYSINDANQIVIKHKLSPKDKRRILEVRSVSTEGEIMSLEEWINEIGC